jgi:hypothetical protein
MKKRRFVMAVTSLPPLFSKLDARDLQESPMAKIIQTTQSRFTRVFAQFGFNQDRPNLRPRDGARGNGAWNQGL